MKRPSLSIESGGNDYKKAMALLMVFSGLNAVFSVIVPVYLSEVGLNGYQIGVLFSLHAFAILFVYFPVGFLSDRWPARLTAAVGMLLVSSLFVCLGFAETFAILAPLFFLGGMGTGIIDMSVMALTYKTCAKGKDGEKFGKYHLLGSIGCSIGFALGGAVAFFSGFSIAMQIIGLSIMLLVPVLSFGSYMGHRVKLSDYRSDLMKAKVLFAGVFIFMFALHWGAETTSIGLFISNNLGLNILGVGLFSFSSGPALGIVAYIFGKRMDRGKNTPKGILMAGAIVSGASLALLTISFIPVSIIFHLLHAIGDGMVVVAFYLWVSKLSGTKRIGGVSSFMMTIGIAGQITGSLVFGPMGYALGYHMPLIISGVVMTSSCLVIFLAGKFLPAGDI